MSKLVKQHYYTSKGEKKVFSYIATVPKKVLKESNINEDDEIIVSAYYGEILIQKKYHCTCMECGYEWDSGKDWGIQSICPLCKVGDIHYDINGGNNDNQEQRTKKDA